jgi:hypothetical protein
MNTSHRGNPNFWIGLAALVLVAAAALFVLTPKNVAPARPDPTPHQTDLPKTTCNLSLPVKLPKAAIAAQLEKAIPRSFQFDVNNDARVYGNPSRGDIAVHIKPAEKRVDLSTTVGGRVQVEKQIVVKISVGVDVSGTITANLAPLAAQDWSVDPRLGLSVKVDNAVAKTAIGDIGITGPVQGAVNGILDGVRASAAKELADKLKFRGDVQPIWEKLNSVHQIGSEPNTWLQITPQSVAFQQFGYHDDFLEAGIALTLQAHVFVQPEAPKTLPTPALPPLNIVDRVPEGFELSIPVEVSYAAINKELQKQLSKETFKLPEVDAWVKISGATLESFGDKVLLTVDFHGKKGWFRRAKGKLYIEGAPVFDSAKAELRVEKLEYTLTTIKAIEHLDWLVHGKFIELLTAASVVPLSGEMQKAKQKAQEQVEQLKGKLPKEIGANIEITEVTIGGLHLPQNSIFVVANAKGKMSAHLQK